MYSVELYSRVRRACHVDGMSKSAAARHFGIDRKTVSKILKHAVPPGYRRNGPPARPKLDPFIPLINQILEEDKSRLKKQRHTSKRIYERLRDEHGFVGGITIVTDYVRERKRRTREVFVPLSHAPGHAQVDFGEALGEIGGRVGGPRCQPLPRQGGPRSGLGHVERATPHPLSGQPCGAPQDPCPFLTR